MENKTENEFVKETKNALNDYNENLLAPRGFEIVDDDNKKEDCVLVIGLNPAGKQADADRERDNPNIPYLYYLDNVKKNTRLNDWAYPSYFKPIYEFVNSTVGGGIKWPWCNIDKKYLESIIKKNFGQYEYDKIIDFYTKHKNNKTTIYIGDMFYYHETDSKKKP